MNHDNNTSSRADLLWKILFSCLAIALILTTAGVLIPVLNVLMMILLGVLVGIALHDLCAKLSRHTPISYRQSYTSVVIFLLLTAAAGSYYVGHQIVQQAAEFTRELDAAAEDLDQLLRNSQFAEMLPSLDQMAETTVKSLPAAWKTVWSISWVFAAVLVIGFVGLYLAFDPQLYKQGLIKLCPPSRRDRFTKVLDAMHSAFARWIVGRLISMSIVGVLTYIGLWFLNVPLPFTLAVVAALLSFVPNFGPILAAVPQMLLALQIGTDTMWYVLLFNLGMQTVESYLLTPIVQQFQVSLPPALIIFAQVLIGVIVGVIGVVVAAPLVLALTILIQTLYLGDCLEDSEPGEYAEQC